MIVKAPAVAKLYGEHAVVYGKLSVAVALSMYSTAEVNNAQSDSLEVALPQMGIKASFSRDELKGLFYDYAFRGSIERFIDAHKNISEYVMPFAVIASRLMHGYGINVIGKRVVIQSEIPIKNGFASSAACSTSFTVALLKHEGVALPEGEIIEIARDGDRVLHKSEGAGRIDVSTSLLGGYVSYSNAKGVVKEPIHTDMEMLFIYTGPKKSTAETVGHVRDIYNSNRAYAESLFLEIEGCAAEGLEALKNGDIEKAGMLMYKNHELLAELGVSSGGLDSVVGIAKELGMYGAKLSGGGGGGMAVAIGKNLDGAKKAIEGKGFSASRYGIAHEGAISYISNLLNTEYSR
ncbi:MAG: mevalonate kinase [Candidatus Micrarchaeaceae archaeon]